MKRAASRASPGLSAQRGRAGLGWAGGGLPRTGPQQPPFPPPPSLAVCEKALAEYLETKRLAFPRFYFVSSADLLDILSNGNNPVEVGGPRAAPCSSPRQPWLGWRRVGARHLHKAVRARNCRGPGRDRSPDASQILSHTSRASLSSSGRWVGGPGLGEPLLLRDLPAGWS